MANNDITVDEFVKTRKVDEDNREALRYYIKPALELDAFNRPDPK